MRKTISSYTRSQRERDTLPLSIFPYTLPTNFGNEDAGARSTSLRDDIRVIYTYFTLDIQANPNYYTNATTTTITNTINDTKANNYNTNTIIIYRNEGDFRGLRRLKYNRLRRYAETIK